MDERELRAHILEMLRFNAARTLSTAEPSRFQVESGGGLSWCIDAARRAPYYNRVLGFDRTAIARLEGLLGSYEHAGLTPQFDLEPEALCPEVSAALSSHGFSPSINLGFLQRSPEPPEPPEVRVERWTHDRADDFLALLATSGATCDPSIWATQRRFYCTDEFRTFVAYLDGRPCAWATLLVLGDTGYLANAYTQDGLRRRGAHTALLSARITDAAELGLSTVWTDVEWRTDSHRNCVRASFRLLTIHTQWTTA